MTVRLQLIGNYMTSRMIGVRRTDISDSSHGRRQLCQPRDGEWQNFAKRVHAKPCSEKTVDLHNVVKSSVNGANVAADSRRLGAEDFFRYQSSPSQLSSKTKEVQSGLNMSLRHHSEITSVGVYWFDEAQAAAAFRNVKDQKFFHLSWRVTGLDR